MEKKKATTKEKQQESSEYQLKKEDISNLIATSFSEEITMRIAVCIKGFDLISASSEGLQVSLLRYFVDNFFEIEQEKLKKTSVKPIDEHVMNDLRYNFFIITERVLDSIFKQNLCVDDLYKKLWDFIQNPTILKDYNTFIASNVDSKLLQSYILFRIVNSNYVPYYCLEKENGLNIDEFQRYKENYSDEINKILFVLNNPGLELFDIKSAHLLKIINSIKDERAKAFLMGHVIAWYTQKIEEISEEDI